MLDLAYIAAGCFALLLFWWFTRACERLLSYKGSHEAQATLGPLFRGENDYGLHDCWSCLGRAVFVLAVCVVAALERIRSPDYCFEPKLPVSKILFLKITEQN